MSVNILGKVNKNIYTKFSNSDFSGFEVYLKSPSDIAFIPKIQKKLNIVSIHQPRTESAMGLCLNNKIGDRAFQVFQKLIDKLKKAKYKGLLVMHGNNYNEQLLDRVEVLKNLAAKVDKLSKNLPNSIKLTFETDALFFNQINHNRALLCEPEDFEKLHKFMKSPLNITIDFEHVWITALFKKFIRQSPESYVSINSPADLKKKNIKNVKAEWQKYLHKLSKKQIDQIAVSFLQKFGKFKKIVNHFHVSGSNPKKYWYDSKKFLPLTGEHLSVGKKGDFLNHYAVKSRLSKLTSRKTINVALEIYPRGNFDKLYYKESVSSRNNLRKIYA